MSLILTLLDYTTPPDLENNPRFKLPILRDNNIYQADFFAPDSEWVHATRNLSFDWLVGNPPWKEFSANDEEDRHVRDWVALHADSCPIGGNQIAEAFVWRSLPQLKKNAVAGLVLPAMTLFKKESARFRQTAIRVRQCMVRGQLFKPCLCPFCRTFRTPCDDIVFFPFGRARV